MNIAIVFHDADFDGKLSNEVCRHWLKEFYPNAAIHSYGWDYGRPVPERRLHVFSNGTASVELGVKWEDYDLIYIVDLSVDELMARPELHHKIIWIDHHKSAIEKWDNVPADSDERFAGFRLDGVAACRLCWQWFINDFHPVRKQKFIDREVNEPELLRLAGEYDVWDLRDPDAKALQFGLRVLDEQQLRLLVQSQFKDFSYADTRLIEAIQAGRVIKSYCDKQNDEYAMQFSHTVQWEGLSFCTLNIGQRGNSDLLRAGIKPEHDACMAWGYDGKQAYVSLYGIAGKDIDLSVIATKHGGGGHRGACGFRCGLRKLADIIGEP